MGIQEALQRVDFLVELLEVLQGTPESSPMLAAGLLVIQLPLIDSCSQRLIPLAPELTKRGGIVCVFSVCE